MIAPARWRMSHPVKISCRPVSPRRTSCAACWTRAAFAKWLSAFLPGIPTKSGADWLMPAVVTDRSDPKLAHIDGLNLSRAWMLEGIAHALPPGDARLAALSASAKRHREAALARGNG